MTGFSTALTVVIIIAALFGGWAMHEAEQVRKRTRLARETDETARRARQYLTWLRS